MNGNDTICAIATAIGGAIGIIRMSGPKTLDILSQVFRGNGDVLSYAANTIHYGHIVSLQQEGTKTVTEIIDEVMVSVFHAPHSYTGEDTAEISCHGSRFILNKVLELLVQKGCRMAGPGEYTMRAYLNGKMDLSQAEAVADLIASTNRAAHDIAISQLRGHFSSDLTRLREQLLTLTSLLELELDFSDHEDLEFADRTELLNLVQAVEKRIAHLADTFETGQALKQGIPVAIVGKTNVGKSTLLNQLVGDDRAIVSDIHGTTRDTIEETMDINGVQFRFIDTAGIRQTDNQIEQIGIARTYLSIEKARIVLWLFDQQPSSEEIQDITAHAQGRPILPIHTKADLIQVCCDDIADLTTSTNILPVLSISAKTGQGIVPLKQAIYQAANIPTFNETHIIITSTRHYDILRRAHASILRVLNGMGAKKVNGQWSMVDFSLSNDLLSEDLRQTIDILAEITGGQITPQETLNHIFSHFCVGK